MNTNRRNSCESKTRGSRTPDSLPVLTLGGGRCSRSVSQFHTMRTFLTLTLAVIAFSCFAQEQPVPTRRILPEDIEQDSIRVVRFSTNSFAVRFTYTEAGAKKMLAVEREHAGHYVITQVGTFERRGMIGPLSARPSGWTEEGYLKHRGDKFFGVSEDDAKKIADGLKKK
jgi:hypothetical protein